MHHVPIWPSPPSPVLPRISRLSSPCCHTLGHPRLSGGSPEVHGSAHIQSSSCDAHKVLTAIGMLVLAVVEPHWAAYNCHFFGGAGVGIVAALSYSILHLGLFSVCVFPKG